MITLLFAVLFLFLVLRIRNGPAGNGPAVSAGRVVDCETWNPPSWERGSSTRWAFNPTGTMGVVCSDGFGSWGIVRVNGQTGIPERSSQRDLRLAPESGTSTDVDPDEEDWRFGDRIREWWEGQTQGFQEGFDDAYGTSDDDYDS